MLKEEFLQQLLNAVYDKGSLAVYDYTAYNFTAGGEEFANIKNWSDLLVRDKLVVYADAEHTVLQITNFGRYWILKGGYDSFLKEGQLTKKPDKDEVKL